jgi:tRNA-splicing ligase RtcB
MKQGRAFPLKSKLGRAYATDMEWALKYALQNREDMLEAVLYIIEKIVRCDAIQNAIHNFNEGKYINENHNHAEVLKDDTVLHRKGATPALAGQMGVIPANQKDGVWITKGLGNAEFLWSASHGAGRTMSRTKAKEYMGKDGLAALKAEMEGVTARTDRGVLDEAPWAYKPIDAILKAQDGILVTVENHFKPLIVIKG